MRPPSIPSKARCRDCVCKVESLQIFATKPPCTCACMYRDSRMHTDAKPCCKCQRRTGRLRYVQHAHCPGCISNIRILQLILLHA
ncbi:hypothetical protein AOQ84DRAFT_353411 [Glonium stellatum]|uniref:Uncharacterized protein n=1 Tax=Glonium stellatum TaxID=574774 RepID=A0A8E2F580_9PEZI|nr:hypothetical protein AOQ84DRAFT_353411 [Glonium stellatum]